MLILIGAFWCFAFLMLSIRASFAAPWSFDVLAPRRLAIAAFGTELCVGMAYILGRLQAFSFPLRVFWGLLGALAMSVLITLFSLVLNRVVAPLPDTSPITISETVQWAMAWFGYTLAWTGTHLALVYHWEGRTS